MVTTGEDAGPDAAKTPPSLRRRKRTCSRRQSEREGGGAEGGERGERGAGEERNRRETSKSAAALLPSGGRMEVQSFLKLLSVRLINKKSSELKKVKDVWKQRIRIRAGGMRGF